MQSSSAATIIKIENDKSISRKHAKIEIKTAKNNRLEFILKDESKYSRYVFQKKLVLIGNNFLVKLILVVPVGKK